MTKPSDIDHSLTSADSRPSPQPLLRMAASVVRGSVVRGGRRSSLDRPLLVRGNKNEVGLSAFVFLFSELIQYSQQRVDTTDELEHKSVQAHGSASAGLTLRVARVLTRRLEDIGEGIGYRALELGCLRDKSSRRETRILGILQFITSVVWKMLFGNAAKDAVSLEKSVGQDNEFMIVEKQPFVATYISSAPCSCAAFVAGIVRGVCAHAATHVPHTPQARPTHAYVLCILLHRRTFPIKANTDACPWVAG